MNTSFNSSAVLSWPANRCAEEVYCAGRPGMSYMQATGLAPRAMRITKHPAKGKLGLRLHLPALRRHNTFATFEEWIQEHMGEHLGMVWLSMQRLKKLGYRAGIALSRNWRHCNMQPGCRSTD